MSASDLLSRLDKVKDTGRGTWIACCPAHPDRSPSMTVRELDDGRVLLHCFAGCTPESVMSAVGLTMSDLFPKDALDNGLSPVRPPFPALDVLETCAREALIASVCASQVAGGTPLPPEDRKRLQQAAARLNEAVDLVRGQRMHDRYRRDRKRYGVDDGR